jgi:hypothetical protein
MWLRSYAAESDVIKPAMCATNCLPESTAIDARSKEISEPGPVS